MEAAGWIASGANENRASASKYNSDRGKTYAMYRNKENKCLKMPLR